MRKFQGPLRGDSQRVRGSARPEAQRGPDLAGEAPRSAKHEGISRGGKGRHDRNRRQGKAFEDV